MFFGGFPTTAATYHFKDFVPSVNADIVDDALRLGCIPLGKTNLHELALGGTSAASYFGPVMNPHDVERVAGGSSGGSAVSVSLSKGAVLGLGTDTGRLDQDPRRALRDHGVQAHPRVAQPWGSLSAQRYARPRGAPHEDHARHGESVRAPDRGANAPRTGQAPQREDQGRDFDRALPGGGGEEGLEELLEGRRQDGGVRGLRGRGGPDGRELREVHESERCHRLQGGGLVLRGASELGEGLCAHEPGRAHAAQAGDAGGPGPVPRAPTWSGWSRSGHSGAC